MFVQTISHVLACLFFVAISLAQAPPPVGTFQWNFASQFFSQNLPTCQTFKLQVVPNNTNPIQPVPPFYMLSFELGGVPQTQLIGNDTNNLNWQVRHQAGSQLWLDVVDSQGASGGIGPLTYTVSKSQVATCIPPSPGNDFTVTANATALTTCQPWGLRIKGGNPPYNLTIMETSSAIVTNVTLGGDDDAFTYINRGDPGRTLLAAVSDVTGRWALGTPMYMASGSTDTSCTGLVSVSGNSTVFDQQDAALAAALAADAKRKTNTIIGVTIPLVFLVLIGSGVGLWYYLKQRREITEAENSPEARPEPYTSPSTVERGGQILSINSFLDNAPATASSSRSRPPLSVSTGSTSPSQSQYTSSNPFSSPHDTYDSSSRSVSEGSSGRNGFTSFPASSIRRSAKSIEAGFSLDSDSTAGTSSGPGRMVVRNPSTSPSMVGSTMTRSNTTVTNASGMTEVLIQHQDGGTIVRELPPPYVDRGNNGPQQIDQPAATSTDDLPQAQ